MWFPVVAIWLSHNNYYLIRVSSLFGHWLCSPCFIRLEILINYVGNKNNCFLLKILSRKLSFFLKNLTDWHNKSLQCCCHTITRSHNTRLHFALTDGPKVTVIHTGQNLKSNTFRLGLKNISLSIRLDNG